MFAQARITPTWNVMMEFYTYLFEESNNSKMQEEYGVFYFLITRYLKENITPLFVGITSTITWQQYLSGIINFYFNFNLPRLASYYSIAKK